MKRAFLYGIPGSITIMLFVSSCIKDKPIVAINSGYNYFPNAVGHYVIYNVDSNVVNTLKVKPDSLYTYQIKEMIDSIYTDESGRPTQKIIRYKRSNPTKDWVIEKVWSANLTTTTAERVEDNIRYIRLTFPLSLNATWNGNAFNTINYQDNWNYTYTSIDQPYTLGANHFDSTLTVIEDSAQTPFSHRYFVEVYARNIGRISKKYIDLEYQTLMLNSIDSLLALKNLTITNALLSQLGDGSVVYTENYVSSN